MIRHLGLLGLLPLVSACTTIAAEPERPPAIPVALTQLLDSIERRLDIAEAVALNKWDSGDAVEAREREAQVIANAKDHANGYGLEAQRVADFFADQIEANKLLQYSALSQWHADGRAPDSERLNLQHQLRPHLDQLQHQLLTHLAALDQQPLARCEQVLAQTLRERAGNPWRAMALIRASGRLCEAS